MYKRSTVCLWSSVCLVIALAGCSTKRDSDATLIGFQTETLRLEPVFIITVNVPTDDAEAVLRSVTKAVPLQYGDYDQVAYLSSAGYEQFRPLEGSRAGEQQELSAYATTQVTFCIPKDQVALAKALEGAQDAHPYEEPVIYVREGYASRSVRGAGADNPNRWWNRPEYSDTTEQDS